MFEWSSRGVGTKNRRSVDLGRIRTTPRGACASSMSGSVASMSSSAAVHLSNLAWRRRARSTVAFGKLERDDVRDMQKRMEELRARGRARRGIAIVAKRSAKIAIVAKRSAKKRQSRKLEKRDDVRDMQKRMEERKAAVEAAAKWRRRRRSSGGFSRSPGKVGEEKPARESDPPRRRATPCTSGVRPRRTLERGLLFLTDFLQFSRQRRGGGFSRSPGVRSAAEVPSRVLRRRLRRPCIDFCIAVAERFFALR